MTQASKMAKTKDGKTLFQGKIVASFVKVIFNKEHVDSECAGTKDQNWLR